MSAEFEHKHTPSDTAVPVVAISLLAILLMLAILMIVNALNCPLCGKSLSQSLYKHCADSHALTCTHGRPIFKTEKLGSRTEAV